MTIWEEGRCYLIIIILNLLGTLVFQPGETSKKITLRVIDDDIYEEDEQFYVKLSNLKYSKTPAGGRAHTQQAYCVRFTMHWEMYPISLYVALNERTLGRKRYSLKITLHF